MGFAYNELGLQKWMTNSRKKAINTVWNSIHRLKNISFINNVECLDSNAKVSKIIW